MSTVVFLGPQRFRPTVVDVLDGLGVEGPLATVTAGWQEREQEIDELADHVHRDLVNLRLYERSEEVLATDTELGAALREKHDRLKSLQSLYRLRLKYALEAAREVMVLDGREKFVREHRQGAIRTIRTLDRQHLTRIRRVHSGFEEKWNPVARPSVLAHREAILEQLEGVSALAIAGGHVAILVNRLRLFGFADLVGDLPVVAWSAGAMAMTQRVVLFHDSPPQGPGNAEVLDAGMGLVNGLVALPHARKRLALGDPVRVALMARRFRPDRPTLLDPGTELQWDGAKWLPVVGARVLKPGGAVEVFKPV
jgi:hypothetical protein